jgi:hypothetical protein
MHIRAAQLGKDLVDEWDASQDALRGSVVSWAELY